MLRGAHRLRVREVAALRLRRKSGNGSVSSRGQASAETRPHLTRKGTAGDKLMNRHRGRDRVRAGHLSAYETTPATRKKTRNYLRELPKIRHFARQVALNRQQQRASCAPHWLLEIHNENVSST